MPLKPPPRDPEGNVEPHDHDGIELNDGVIRRVSELQIVNDPKIGGRRISSMAFKASAGPKGGMSVDLQRQIEEDGLDPHKYVTTPSLNFSQLSGASGLRLSESASATKT